MKKFSFDEAKNLGTALTPDEMKMIVGGFGSGSESGYCLCYLNMKPGYILDTGYTGNDVSNIEECKIVCKNMCEKNVYCASVYAVKYSTGSGSEYEKL